SPGAPTSWGSTPGAPMTSWGSAPGPEAVGGGGCLSPKTAPLKEDKHVQLDLAPTSPQERRPDENSDDLWFQEVIRTTPLRHSIFSGCFNIEYWSAELFGPPSDGDPHKKVFEVHHDEGRVGMIEVEAHKGEHLEPFDRLVLLALMGLWHDQGRDPLGR